MDQELKEKLENARRKLLDLSMRNRLLNYRSTKARSLRLLAIDPRVAFDTLVTRQRPIRLKASTDETQIFGGTGRETSQPSLLCAWEPSSIGKSDQTAETTYDLDHLSTRVRRLNSDARSMIEEKGYNVLYLAVGFLEWVETKIEIGTHLAPLVLIPVSVENSGQGRTFQIVWNNDDIMFNESLRSKLHEQSLDLPENDELETAEQLDGYYESVRQAVPQSWRILDQVQVDFFSFANFSLYHDLDPEGWEGTNHFDNAALLRGLLLGEKREQNDSPAFDENSVDERLTASNLLQVVDADPSQISVIEDAKNGRDLVVEGPPGTGKSQTIVNIIAELVGNGQKVLFVSQKMAALDVVKRRLDNVGLGSACLELHSNKATKEHFVDQLRQVISKRRRSNAAQTADYDRIDTLRDQLNEYARALREPVGASKLSPFALFALKERALRRLRPSVLSVETQEFQFAWKWGETRITKLRSTVREFQLHMLEVSPVAQNPWHGCEPKQMLPNDVEVIRRQLTKTLQDVMETTHKITDLARLGIKPGTSLAEELDLIRDGAVIADMPVLEPAVALHRWWRDRANDGTRLINVLVRIQAAHSDPELRHPDGLTTQQVDETAGQYLMLCNLHGCYDSWIQQIGSVFSRRYRTERKKVETLLTGITHIRDRRLMDMINRLRELLADEEWITTAESDGTAFFGRTWKGLASDIAALQEIASSMELLWRAIKGKRLTRQALQAVSLSHDERTSLATVEQAVRVTASLVEQVHETIGCHPSTSIEQTPFNELTERLETWRDSTGGLASWSDYVIARSTCVAELGNEFVETAESGKYLPQELEPYYDACVADSLLRKAFSERPSLARFSRPTQEAAIGEYQLLDKRIINLNRDRLGALIDARIPDIATNSIKGSEQMIIINEINRRRHRPIRTLLRSAGNYVQALKPCFLMSPLTVAEFLDPASLTFDCIVFDEASQVKPEEALGVLLRGKQLIVMGDSKQLPPTSFFEHMVEDDSDEEDEEQVSPLPTMDQESILDLCNSAFPGCARRLRWHYRSRHESLIAVSNKVFYDNDLNIFPSATHFAADLGLKFVFVENGVYDRGKNGSRTNRIEAKEIVQRALRHFEERPELSLGIGTFNVEQQRAIEDQLAVQRELHPEYERFFDRSNPEYCFVKNLETIQGDERDVIYVSVGYGYDENHKLSTNFGPVNRVQGGARRLNVLMTRSRTQCVIFANFHYGELAARIREDPATDPGRKSPLSVLCHYMEYGETGTFTAGSESANEPDSGFEESVGKTLEENGYTIRYQVGCAGYRVDIGVVDPRDPGRFAFGVECDGATYHSSRVARERDRLRQEVLERLDWTLIRVWSTDWYRDRFQARSRLLEAAERYANQGNLRTRYGSDQSKLSTDFPTSRPATDMGDDPGKNSAQPRGSETETMGPADPSAVPYRVFEKRYHMAAGVSFYDVSITSISEIVTQVVLVEGPIHRSEIARRIATSLSLKCTTKMQQKVARAIDHACTWSGKKRELGISRGSLRPGDELEKAMTPPILLKDGFVWVSGTNDVAPRYREDPLLAKIELICDDEIRAAAVSLLRSAVSMPLEYLATETAHLLGVRNVHDATRSFIERVIESAVRAGALVANPNGNLAIRPPKTAVFKTETQTPG